MEYFLDIVVRTKAGEECNLHFTLNFDTEAEANRGAKLAFEAAAAVEPNAIG